MKTIAIILFLTLSYVASAQHIRFDWQNCLENTYGNHLDILPADIVATGDGYIIVSNYDNPNYVVPPGTEQADLWVIKINHTGDVVWSKFLCGTRNDGPVLIIATTNTNYYIFGSTGSDDGDITYDPYPNASNYWIIKINGNGDKLWDRVVGGSIWDVSKDATATPDGGIVALGQTLSSDGDVTHHYGFWDLWAIKLDSLGNTVWDFTLGSSGAEWGTGIIHTSDGGYLICGSGAHIDNAGNITCTPHTFNNAEALLVKLNADGVIEWQQCYGGSEDDGFTALSETTDGFIIFGSTASSDGNLQGSNYHLGYNHLGGSTFDYWILKTDFSGNIKWQKCYGGTLDEFSNRLFQPSTKDLVLFGTTESMDGDIIGTHSIFPDVPYKDIWMLKLDSIGNYKGQRCIGSRSDEHFINGVLLLNDSNYVLTTQFFIGSNGDIACGTDPNIGGKFKLWVTHFTDSLLVTGIEPMQELKTSIYPNPAQDIVTIENPLSGVASITFYDVFGRSIRKCLLNDVKTAINVSNFENGIYFYIVQFGKNETKGKLIISR